MDMGRVRSSHYWFRAVRLATIVSLLVATGCVERQFIVETNIPNCQVYVDNVDVGTAPTYSTYDYYGYHNVTIVHPGYETLTERVHVVAPWYAYPPFDFAVEALWPFHIHDKRRYFFNMRELTKPRVDELIRDAESLRQRSLELPPPERPAVPRPRTSNPAQNGPVVPAVGPQPGPGTPGPSPSVLPAPTVLPPVGPVGGQPVLPPVGSTTGVVVPSVLPPTQ